MTQARRNRGIVITHPSKVVLIEECESEMDELSNDDLSDPSYTPEKSTTNVIVNGCEFDLLLTNEEWEKIKPDECSEKKSQTRLKKMVWAEVITKAFWKRYNLPCAFLGESSHVRKNPIVDDKDYFLKIICYCKDSECNNKMIGIAKQGPSEAGLQLIITTRDTRDKYHREVKRPLNGPERKAVGQKLKKESAAIHREELLREDMKFGQNVPPHIKKNHIYKQAKMEMLKEELGVGKKEKLNVIESIQKMAADPRYGNCIHQMGALQFYVWYCTQEQIHIMKEYCRIMKQRSAIAIDASGKFVKKFEIYGKKLTGHILFYTATINFDGTTLCVNQMLSEVQTQEFIEDWLKHWKRLGTSTPGEVCSDYERAIPLSACLAFNNMSLKLYIDECFKWAWLTEEEKKMRPRPAPTLILIDVAHLMAMVARWKCLKDHSHPYTKPFYLRCVALLIDCRDIKRFLRIFLLICAVALCPSDESFIPALQMTIQEIKRELAQYTGDRSNVIEDLEASMTMYEENKDKDLSKGFIEGDNGTLTHQWIKKLINMVQPIDLGKENPTNGNIYFLS